VWAIAVFLMVEGGVLGARTTGVAALLGMVGMFIILVTYMNACDAWNPRVTIPLLTSYCFFYSFLSRVVWVNF